MRVNNNIKFYTFIDILRTYSDENISLSIREIQHHMQKRLGVMIDRRTIYSYIKDMKALGMDISDYDKTKEGYYLSSNYFEPDEIRILADAVLTSNFVTKEKTKELLEKLRSFNSIYNDREFLRDIFVEDVSKSINEDVFSNISKVFEAIKLGKKIRFNYCDYDYYRSLVHRLDDSGMPMVYKKNPVYVVLRNSSYYFVCMDEDEGVLEHFRVDRMKDIELVDEYYLRLPKNLDAYAYANNKIYMYSGDETGITLRCDKKALDVIIDTFGKDVMLADEGETFTVYTKCGKEDIVKFCLQYVESVDLLEPLSLREEVRKVLLDASNRYQG